MFYTETKIHIFFILTNIFLIIIISIQAIAPSGYSYFSEFIYKIISFVDTGFYSLIKKISFFSIYLKDTKSQHNELEKLRKEIKELKIKSYLYEATKKENKQLRELLNLTQKGDYNFVAAEVIGYDMKPEFFKTIRINKGEKNRIRKNYPVMTADGVVGFIAKTSSFSSQVLLIIDKLSAISISIPNAQINAIAYGDGSYMLKGNFIPLTAYIPSNSLVITSGLDGIFPTGLPVGKTIDLIHSLGLYKEIYIKPFVNFYNLKNVVILIPKENN